MKSLNFIKVGVMLAVPFVLSGCIDDDYDLSDIDGTVELQVKDLTIPMNIDEIKLSNIIDIEGNEQIKEIDGEYAFIEEGNFQSDGISIPFVEIAAPEIEPTVTELDLNIPENFPLSDVETSVTELHYTVETSVSPFTYETHSVSDYIMSMDKIGTELEVKMNFEIADLKEFVKTFSVRNFELQLPKGLNLSTDEGVYNPSTGVLAINEGEHSGYSLEFVMKVSEIDIKAAGIKYDHDTHTIIFSDYVGIHSGEIVIAQKDLVAGINPLLLPKTIELHSEYDLSKILVKTFTGDVKYTLGAMDIAPIAINNLPDILAQDETNITLANPQIYLSLNNPLADYKLYAQSGLAITSQWSDLSKTETLDNEVFTIAGTPMNVFCMSPYAPSKYYVGYENAEHVPFSGLADVLSGDGLPVSLKVTLDNPNVPVQHVEDFQLGKDFGQIQGKYTFYTPLELGVNSKIVYSSIEDGWNDEDVDAITIKVMDVTASVTNNLPLDIEITGYPIDVNGNQINNVVVEGVSVEANATDHPLAIRITGEITHLDGIYFKAVAEPKDNNSMLKPSEYIHLKDLKVKISGNYINEL
ncbi:MAG: hypothetical protein IJN66_02875 [Muribaculaceae bacterium]|nr:hypothetical protein [Muribaculaceae bacterium]